MKYVLMGAFSSGILAYGFSILYGISGSTNLQVIATAVAERTSRFGHGDVLTILALGTVAAGVFFQNRRGPVSSVGAGRLRRRANAD